MSQTRNILISMELNVLDEKITTVVAYDVGKINVGTRKYAYCQWHEIEPLAIHSAIQSHFKDRPLCVESNKGLLHKKAPVLNSHGC